MGRKLERDDVVRHVGVVRDADLESCAERAQAADLQVVAVVPSSVRRGLLHVRKPTPYQILTLALAGPWMRIIALSFQKVWRVVHLPAETDFV